MAQVGPSKGKGLGLQVCLKVIEIEPLQCLIRLMDKILHDPKDPKLWELWYIPYNG